MNETLFDKVKVGYEVRFDGDDFKIFKVADKREKVLCLFPHEDGYLTVYKETFNKYYKLHKKQKRYDLYLCWDDDVRPKQLFANVKKDLWNYQKKVIGFEDGQIIVEE